MQETHLFDDLADDSVSYSPTQETCSTAQRLIDYLQSTTLLKPEYLFLVLIFAGLNVAWLVNNWLDAITSSSIYAEYDKAVLLSNISTVGSFSVVIVLTVSDIIKTILKARVWRTHGASQRVIKLLVSSSIIRGLFSVIAIPFLVHLMANLFVIHTTSGYSCAI